MVSESLINRLWSKVDIGKPDECWLFTGYLLKGYGRIGVGSRTEGVAYAHRVAAEIAYGPCPPGQTARHLCGNAACCNPKHLAYGDQSANERDKLAHGRSNRGERHGMSKLTANDVREIRRQAGSKSQREIGLAFGVTQQAVYDIIHRRTWSSLPD